MQVKYYSDDDVLHIIASPRGGSGGTLRDHLGVFFALEEGTENITRIDVHGATWFLPLDGDRDCYDADTDILTLGDKPSVDYRIVDNGDIISYRQYDGSGWDVVALDLRRASEHLAPVLAHFTTDQTR